MAYKLIITERAEELLTEHIDYLLERLNNRQAAVHLLDSVENIYDRLENNPFQFPKCKDAYLSCFEYREAVLPDMHYLIIYKIQENCVYVLGIFHELEQYKDKI